MSFLQEPKRLPGLSGFLKVGQDPSEHFFGTQAPFLSSESIKIVNSFCVSAQTQGDQIGRIFAQRVIVYFWQFLEN
jgi:hypothetical protein